MINAFFIALSLVVFSLVVVAFVDCLKTRPPQWPLWLLFILLGFCPVSLNMTSGDITVELLSVLVLGAKIFRDGKGDSAAWVLGLSVPLGALIWLGKNRLGARSMQPKRGVSGAS